MNRLSIGFGIALLFFATLSAFAVDQNKLVPPSQQIPPTLFGMHIHRAGSTTPWPSVPVPARRLWDARVTWPDLEPSKGQWRFGTLDNCLAMAQEHNQDLLMTLGLTPRWASARPQEPSGYQPGFAAEPVDIGDWRAFVTAVTTRYKGRLHYYEIWNEPNLKQFWSGNVDQLLALTREASQIIHNIDPQAIVVSPPATSGYGVKWLTEFLSKGGGQYVDVIGYHFYVADQPPEAMVPVIRQVQQTMADNGVGNKPIWDTEAGWFKPNPFPSAELGAGYTARSFILNWAAGVQRFYWYSWDNHKMTIQMTEDDDTTLTPAGRAYGVIQKWLIGARMDSCNQDADNTWTCQLTRDGVHQWIVWNPDGKKTISVPSSWHPKSVTPLLEEAHPWTGSSLDVGPVPVLVTP